MFSSSENNTRISSRIFSIGDGKERLLCDSVFGHSHLRFPYDQYEFELAVYRIA